MIMLNELPGFASRLCEKMAEAGMTQADLCRHIGIASSMISHYCTGQRIPSVPVAAKIARVLNTTVEYLTFGDYKRQLKDGHSRPFAVAETSLPCLSGRPQNQSSAEEALAQMYRMLNTTGKEKVLEYTEDLLSSGRYAQHND